MKISPFSSRSLLMISAALLLAPFAHAQDGAPAENKPAPETESTVGQQTASYNEGWTALKANDYDKAGDAFTRVLTIAPSDAMARALLGYVRLKQARYDEALEHLQNPILSGNALDARTRAVVQNNIGTAYWNTKRFSLALPAYENAVKLDPNYADARYNMALALLSQKRAKDALPHFQQLTKNNATDPLFFDGLGQSYEAMARWNESFAAYRKAMALAPKDATYPFNLAMAMLRSDPNNTIKGRRDAAAEPLRKTIALNPKNATAHLQLGLIFIEKARWTDAQNMLRRYVELTPDDFLGHFNLALAYDYNAQFDDALREYSAAEKLQPQDAATKNNIGRIHLKRKEYDDAIARFREALAAQPNFLDARNNMAMALAEKGDFAASNAEWTAMIDNATRQLRALPKAGSKEETPQNKRTRTELTTRLAAARGALAGNLLRSEKYAEAITTYKALLAAAPGNNSARSNLGLALYHTKKYDEALAAYGEVIKRDPKNAIAYNNLGVVQEAKGDKVAALESYEKAIELRPDYTEAKSNRDRLRAGTQTG